MTESENLSFNEKIISIQNDLKAPKSQYSKYGNYNYRSCEDILKAVKPLNKKMGLLLTLTDEPVMIGDRFYIKATALLTDGNESKSIVGYAREAESKTKMDDSQVTGSASSYARKYALNGLYLIDDKKDSDALPPTDQASEENLHEVFIETFNKYVRDISNITKTSKEVIAANALGKLGYERIEQVTEEFYSELIGYLKILFKKAEGKYNKQPKEQPKKSSWEDF